jgi:hypothetical protein
MASVFVTGAQAVHDSGAFQLDGNAFNTANSTPAMPTAADDADNICGVNPASTGDNTAGQGCHAATGVALPTTSGATKSGFVTDGNGQFASGANDDQWTGGSKDDMNIEDWLYKQAASSNDKSDIENAFAAVYTVPAGAPHEAGHKIIYFGGDRTSNSGSENTAFWFLQDAVTENPNTVNGCTLSSGCGFTGSHVPADPGADGCLTQGSLSIQLVTVGGVKAGTSPCTETDATPDTGGDVLVVSAFTVGGTQPNTTAYEFVGVGNAPKGFCVTSKCSVLQITPVVSGCDPNTQNDPVCAITNQNVKYASCPSGTPVPPCVAGNPEPIPSPWTYGEKSSDTATSGASKCTVATNKMCPGIYFEAGLDLTALGLGGECTSSFTMDTRSSASVDASLQDLAIGQLGSCGSSLSTTPKNGSGGTIPAGGLSIGTGTVKATDQADLTVTGIDTWSGTLKFFLCGPIPAGETCDGQNHVGLQIGSTMNVNQSSGTSDGLTPPGRLILSSQALLTSAANLTTGAPGRYCWRGEFHSNTTGVSDRTDSSEGECFVVKPVRPTLTTQASCTDGSGTAQSPCLLGDVLRDTATLGGTATEPGTNAASVEFPTIFQGSDTPTLTSAQGTITWTLNNPASDGTASCTNGTKTLSTSTASVNGDGTYPTTTPSNIAYTTTSSDALGTYTFGASYPGDGPNTLAPTGAACSTSNTSEQVTTSSTASTTTTQKWLPQDMAHVTAQGGAPVAGYVVFQLFESTNCSGTAVQTFGNDPNARITVDASGNAATNNTTYYVDKNIQISWKATFTSTNGVASGNPAPCERSDIANLSDGP